MSKEKVKQRQKREFSKEDIDSFVTPVKELPEAKRLRHSPLYDGIVDRVMSDTSKKVFKIEVPNMSFKSIYAPLDSRIKKRKLPLKIKIRNKILYLEKQ